MVSARAKKRKLKLQEKAVKKKKLEACFTSDEEAEKLRQAALARLGVNERNYIELVRPLFEKALRKRSDTLIVDVAKKSKNAKPLTEKEQVERVRKHLQSKYPEPYEAFAATCTPEQLKTFNFKDSKRDDLRTCTKTGRVLPSIFFIRDDKAFRDGMGATALCDDMLGETNLFLRLSSIATTARPTTKIGKMKIFYKDVMALHAEYGGCIDCGVCDVRVLTNDHLIPTTKHDDNEVSRPGEWMKHLDAWLAEFLLCVPRCHACHKISSGVNKHFGPKESNKKSDAELTAKELASRKQNAKNYKRTKKFRESLKTGDPSNPHVAEVNAALASNGKGQLGTCCACDYKFDTLLKTPACTFDHLDAAQKTKRPGAILSSKVTPATLTRNFIAEAKRAGFGVLCSNCDHLWSNHKVNVYESYDAVKNCLNNIIEQIVQI